MPVLDIVRVPALDDNYVWLVHDPVSDETIVIDPAEAVPVLDAAREHGWTIGAIWNTHWHRDHTGGNLGIKDATGCTVTGPAAERDKIPGIDRAVGEGDTVRIGGHVATVMETPAHTAGHISFHFADDHLLFCGDTMFAMGCGRLFEGEAQQLFAALSRFAEMPDDTRVYCAHEYTLANGRFAATAEPDNEAIRARLVTVERMRNHGEATIPTTIGEERATNPFLRAATVQQLAELRERKDAF